MNYELEKFLGIEKIIALCPLKKHQMYWLPKFRVEKVNIKKLKPQIILRK